LFLRNKKLKKEYMDLKKTLQLPTKLPAKKKCAYFSFSNISATSFSVKNSPVCVK
jgi:hypothetical protein